MIRPGLSIERYRQLARVRNSIHSPLFYFDSTFANTLSNLRVEYNRSKLSCGKVTAAIVFQAYKENTK